MPDDEKPPARLNYPSNSHKSREQPETPEKKVEKVISGEAVQRKKPLGKRIIETFSGDDAQSVGQYVLFEVILPAAKTMIVDAITEAANRAFFGGTSRPSGGGGNKRTAYNRMYSDRNEPRKPEISSRGRASHNFDELVLPTRGDAEFVLEGLINLVSQYDVATVSDLYDLVGITGSFADMKYGWTDLRDAGIRPIRGGYLLNLPRPEAID